VTQKTTPMNLAEAIGVAVGITVGILVVYFTLVGVPTFG
jgi:hypothetical protein